MIGIRLTPGYTLADVHVDEDGVIPVVGETPPDFDTHDDVIAFRLGQLRRRRRDLNDDQFRELLRSDPYLARYAEAPSLSWQRPEPKRALTLTEAQSLIEDGLAVAVDPNLDDLEDTVDTWRSAVASNHASHTVPDEMDAIVSAVAHRWHELDEPAFARRRDAFAARWRASGFDSVAREWEALTLEAVGEYAMRCAAEDAEEKSRHSEMVESPDLAARLRAGADAARRTAAELSRALIRWRPTVTVAEPRSRDGHRPRGTKRVRRAGPRRTAAAAGSSGRPRPTGSDSDPAPTPLQRLLEAHLQTRRESREQLEGDAYRAFVAIQSEEVIREAHRLGLGEILGGGSR